eukprot:SAG22_NODE_1520_length_4237_cov_11.486225_2_plen_111_part_00
MPLWAHPHRRLSNPTPVCEWKFAAGGVGEQAHLLRQLCSLAATESGQAHGVALWMEYPPVNSAAPDAGRFWASQGVRLLARPVVVDPGQRVGMWVQCGGGASAEVSVDLT